MKLKPFVMCFGLSFLTSVYANNACQQIAGEWNGKGVVSLGRLTCQYKGNATATPASQANSYDFEVDMTLISGQCPAHEHLLLSGGACDPNTRALTLKSDDANLSGTLEEDGRTAHLTGTVSFELKNKKVTANVESLELHKK